MKELLSLDYQLIIDENESNYRIILPNKKKLLIKDEFFCKVKNNESYLLKENIPNKINYLNSSFCIDNDLPILYGDNKITVDKQQITCYADIFASAFFMLSRWEEFVILKRDEFGRFPEKLSLSYKHKFYHRPIVNEYAELIWNLIEHLDNSIKRKKKKYSVHLTHDIDFLFRYDKAIKFLKAIIGDIVKRKSVKQAIQTIKTYKKTKVDYKQDPYYLFDYLMDAAEKQNLKSSFYIKAQCKNEKDASYDIKNEKLKIILDEIKQRGHKIALHGSINTYKDKKNFTKEKQRLESIIKAKVNENRQHFLIFDVPRTWRILDELNFVEDSSFGFAFDGGFRCGVCDKFTVFDILQRKQLKLKELPIIAMEGAIKKASKTPDEFLNRFRKLADTVKKYNGKFVILWHNNNFKTAEWQKYAGKFVDVIDY